MTFGLYLGTVGLMPRVIFPGNTQVKYLKTVKSITGLNSDRLAIICGVVGRSFRDWARGRFSISQMALVNLQNRFPEIEVPRNIKIVDDFWYTVKGGKKGALRRLELYGPPGTPEGRRKGGINSQLRRRENPEKYRLLRCNLRKKFKIDVSSIEFAEATGIILGDGCISANQLRITVSSLVDRPYAKFIEMLFYRIFEEKPTLIERLDCHAINLTISGVGLIEELKNWGFIKGDKVRQQVDFPAWIWQNTEFQKACVRGLMDTDGGCYFHKHKSNGLFYRNFGMCFTNKSLPIVQSVAKVLKSLGLKFSVARQGTQIYIYSLKEIKKYFKLIGSHNPKNNVKFRSYLSEKSHRIRVEGGMREWFNRRSWKDRVGVSLP